MSSQSSPTRSRSGHIASNGITVTRRVAQRPRRQNPDESFNTSTSFEEGFSICAFGDLSMSEAYNAPAPTTGEYPLKLKRTRPPKPKKLQLPKSESKDLSNLLQQLCKPSLNEYPLSPTSDFKRFVDGLQSAQAASPFLTNVSKEQPSVGDSMPPLRGNAGTPLSSSSTTVVSKAKRVKAGSVKVTVAKN